MDIKKGLKILVIDDEPQIRRLLMVALAAHGYEMQEASCGQDGLDHAAVFRPDLVILDLSLPDMEGIQVLKRLREWSEVPVIILSVKEKEEDKVNAFDSGADDYLTKPFGMGELLARIRAAIRHAAKTNDEPILTVGEITVDIPRRTVSVNGNEVKLTPIEYDLLKNLALNAGKVLTQKQLLRTVWGPEYEEETHYLRVYIGQLRRKIEPDPSRPVHIITEPGVGYRLL